MNWEWLCWFEVQLWSYLTNISRCWLYMRKDKAYLNCGLLGCDTVSFCAWLPMFGGKVLPSFCSYSTRGWDVTPYSLIDHYRYAYPPRVLYNGKNVDMYPGATWVGISNETPDFVINSICDILQFLQVNRNMLPRFACKSFPVHHTSLILTYNLRTLHAESLEK